MPSILPSAFGLLAGAAAFLASDVTANPLQARAALDCSNNASNGTIFKSTTGSYQILCGVDYNGGDMSSTSTSSFEACIAACDATSGCVDVSYVNGACYLKSVLTTPSPNGAVWTAKSVSVTNVGACINNALTGTVYTASNLELFLIACSTDLPGGDMGNVATSSFTACMNSCSTTSGCVAASYANGICYMKNTIVPSISSSSVQSAILQSKTAPTLTCINNVSNGTTFVGTNGGVYTIYCATDFWGGDLSNLQSPSFASCIDSCDQTAGCTDVSYVSGTCYLKNSQTPGVSTSSVWSANKGGKAAVSSSSSSVSSSSTSTSSSSSTSSTVSTTATTTKSSTTTTTTTTTSVPTTTTTTTTTSVPTTTTTTTTSKATTTTTTTTTAAPTPTTAAPTTTLVTTTKAATTTTSAAASATPFYLQISGSGTLADGQYVVVGSGTAGKTSFTYLQVLATKFVYDANLNLVEQNPTSGNVAGLLTANTASGTFSQLQFSPIGTSKTTQASCGNSGSGTACTIGGKVGTAAVCLSDVYTTLWFGVGTVPGLPSIFNPFATPNTCAQANLNPISAN